MVNNVNTSVIRPDIERPTQTSDEEDADITATYIFYRLELMKKITKTDGFTHYTFILGNFNSRNEIGCCFGHIFDFFNQRRRLHWRNLSSIVRFHYPVDSYHNLWFDITFKEELFRKMRDITLRSKRSNDFIFMECRNHPLFFYVVYSSCLDFNKIILPALFYFHQLFYRNDSSRLNNWQCVSSGNKRELTVTVNQGGKKNILPSQRVFNIETYIKDFVHTNNDLPAHSGGGRNKKKRSSKYTIIRTKMHQIIKTTIQELNPTDLVFETML